MSKGGARPGCGRKVEDVNRVTMTCRVLPETRERARQLKARGVRLGRLVDSAIEEKFQEMIRPVL